MGNFIGAALLGFISFRFFRSALKQHRYLEAQSRKTEVRSREYTEADRAKVIAEHERALNLTPEQKALAQGLFDSLTPGLREKVQELARKEFEAHLRRDKATADKMRAEVEEILFGKRE